MSKQKHDLGVRKRKSGQEKNHPYRLLWLRVKRRQPGPEPLILRFEYYKDWLELGKPSKPPWPEPAENKKRRKKKT